MLSRNVSITNNSCDKVGVSVSATKRRIVYEEDVNAQNQFVYSSNLINQSSSNAESFNGGLNILDVVQLTGNGTDSSSNSFSQQNTNASASANFSGRVALHQYSGANPHNNWAILQPGESEVFYIEGASDQHFVTYFNYTTNECPRLNHPTSATEFEIDSNGVFSQINMRIRDDRVTSLVTTLEQGSTAVCKHCQKLYLVNDNTRGMCHRGEESFLCHAFLWHRKVCCAGGGANPFHHNVPCSQRENHEPV